MKFKHSDYTVFEIDQKIRELVRKHRILANLTAKEVAERVGVSIGTYSSFENINSGPSKIKLITFLSILDLFGLMDQLQSSLEPKPRTHDEAARIMNGKRVVKP